MTTIDHVAFVFGLAGRGVRVLCWESKAELLHVLLVLQAASHHFPAAPTTVPTDDEGLQQFSLHVFERPAGSDQPRLRVLLIAQASARLIGGWLNGCRQRLAEPPGTLIVIRAADLPELRRCAPDLMSFTESSVFEACDILPLAGLELLKKIVPSLPSGWISQLCMLPGADPGAKELLDWLDGLQALQDQDGS